MNKKNKKQTNTKNTSEKQNIEQDAKDVEKIQIHKTQQNEKCLNTSHAVETANIYYIYIHSIDEKQL